MLHWFAIPAIVYLRSGFGFSFLSPKSVFLVFSWATVLFTIYAWLEEGAWQSYWALSSLGMGAAFLYVTHLVVAFTRETRRTGKHDFYSGTSHILKLPGLTQFRGNARIELAIQLWVEPLIVLVVATILRSFFAEHLLSQWLRLVAVAMWCKEFINYWYHLRHRKKQEDVFSDAEETMDGNPSATEFAAPNATGRKPREKRQRATTASGQSDEELRFAEVLRLLPPYDLQQAEQNYCALMKSCRPDPNDESARNGQRVAELHDAIEFFRSRPNGTG
ncbi:MAG: hypothetical protein JNM99_14850 [Verrucomicrobiaceae bacterium]|nr:hypothetical protein [Verrucomicrobiaceae bacterium]